MIAPQDLRIGNWVYAPAQGMYCQVHDILQSTGEIRCNMGLQANYDMWDFEYQELEYVQITPEILDRAKFSYDFIVYSIGNFWLAPNDGWYDVYLHGLSSGISCRIKHLHQLQNLVHALTNTELTITI